MKQHQISEANNSPVESKGQTGPMSPMSQTVDDGYDSDTMVRVDNKIRREIEGVKAKCFQ